mmetsp:Transcript_4722/g.9185  ORF Transcript_4722/g.9185 Transcript_4722/m.9185 type:complete len:131 (+) Transcript_4722:61-453(+)
MPLKTWLKTKKKKGQESPALAADNGTNQSQVSDADVTNQKMSSASPARKVANETRDGLLVGNSCQPLSSPASLPESWRVGELSLECFLPSILQFSVPREIYANVTVPNLLCVVLHYSRSFDLACLTPLCK